MKNKPRIQWQWCRRRRQPYRWQHMGSWGYNGEAQAQHRTCPRCKGIGSLNKICLACEAIGTGLQHSVPLTCLFEDECKVNAVEEADKPTSIKWLVDSRASVHVTNCKDNLNEPDATDQAVTIGSGKVMTAQFKGRRTTLLMDTWTWLGGHSRIGGHSLHSRFQEEDCQPLHWSKATRW